MQGYRSNPPAAFGDDMVVRINDMLTSESKNVEDGTSHSINLPKSNVLQFFTEKGNKVSVRPSGTEPKIKYYFSLKATWSRDKSMEEQEKRLEDSLSQILKALRIT
jgi:phosphoglucomutase